MVTDERTRGQVVLIGAIALAFILFGIVVVFNGVLYTETLSSGTAGQGVSEANVTEYEIERTVGCILDKDGIDDGSIESNIESFDSMYRTTTVNSEPAIMAIDHTNVNASKTPPIADIEITYDSADGTYTHERRIDANDCPRS